MKRTVLVTGGAGFIGSNLIQLLVNKYNSYTIINYDNLTYAGNLENLKAVEGKSNYIFVKGDITNGDEVDAVFTQYSIDSVIHLAAESHVDRSISDPLAFINTNIVGTATLLNAARKFWKGNFTNKLFYHISTDEVYGSLGTEGLFLESTPYDPRSPYSASKASSDHLVRAYYHTYNLPIVISNCSNNYGPNQFPEKLIPLAISNIKNNKPVPIYGKGENVRDWLFVKDHAEAIDSIFHKGAIGETYNIGGSNEWKNIDLIRLLCQIMDNKLGREKGTSEKLITFVSDRAGHDLRYAIDSTKLQNSLGWAPKVIFSEGLELTVDWYLANEEWLNRILSGDYQNHYKAMYEGR